MNYFDLDDRALPATDVAPLEEKHLSAVTASNLAILLATEGQTPPTITAAFVYDRKGYATFDSLVGNANPAYRSDRDDLIVEIRYRVRPYTGVYDKMLNLGSRIKEQEKQAKAAELQAQIAQQQAALDASVQELNALQD